MGIMLDAFSFESDRYNEHKSMAGILIFYSRPSAVIRSFVDVGDQETF